MRLARPLARNLDGHLAVREVPLQCQEHPGESSPAELLDQPKAANRLAGARKFDILFRGLFAKQQILTGVNKIVDIDQIADLGGDGREPRIELTRVERLACILAHAIFFVDKRSQQVRRQFRESPEIRLDATVSPVSRRSAKSGEEVPIARWPGARVFGEVGGQIGVARLPLAPIHDEASYQGVAVRRRRLLPDPSLVD